MTLAVHHLAVVVRDLPRAERFYCGVLGLTVIKRWQDDAGAPRSFWCELGQGAFLAVEKASDNLPAKADKTVGWHCLALGITPDQRRVMAEKLTAAGHAVVRETAFTFYVRDPDNNLLGFSTYPQKSA